MSHKDASTENQKDIVDGLYKTKGGIYCLFREAQFKWVRAVFNAFGEDNFSHLINKSDIDLNNCTLIKDDSEVLIMCGDKVMSIGELMKLNMMELKNPEITVTDSKEKEDSGTVSISDKYPKYYRNVSHLTMIDTYDVCDLFNVNDSSGATQHAIKKLLLSGTRNGGKSAEQDIQEAIVSLKRRLAILKGTQD